MRRVLFCLLLALALALPAWAAPKVTAKRGTVEVAVGDGEFVPVKRDMELQPGSRIRTQGRRARVEITFDDGSRAVVSGDSLVALSDVKRTGTKERSGTTEVMVAFGRVWSSVQRSATGDASYRVHTTNAVAGVRGTEFDVVVAEDGSTRVAVDDGEVAVDGEQGGGTVGAGKRRDVDYQGAVSDTAEGPKKPPEERQYDGFEKKGRKNLRENGEEVAKHVGDRVEAQAARIKELTAKLDELEKQYVAALEKKDQAAADQALVEWGKVQDELKRAGLTAESGYQLFGHYDELADRKAFSDWSARGYVKERMAMLRRVRASFSKLVEEGNKRSPKDLEEMGKEMREGRSETRDEDNAAETIFGDDSKRPDGEKKEEKKKEDEKKKKDLIEKRKKNDTKKGDGAFDELEE